jgi:hypothetical protein
VLGQECTMKNMSVGEFRIVNEKHMRKMIKENDLFVLAVSASHCTHCCEIEPKLEPIYLALET